MIARTILLALVLLLVACPLVAHFAWLGPLLVGAGFRRQAFLSLVGCLTLSGLALRCLLVRGSAS